MADIDSIIEKSKEGNGTEGQSEEDSDECEERNLLRLDGKMTLLFSAFIYYF